MNLESEMYPYIAKYFEDLGYEVKAEVKSADVVAVRADHVLVVEMKLRYSMKLVYQCIERQRSFDDVYMAIVATNAVIKNLRNIKRLVKRLGLGLILLHERPSGITLELVEVPTLSAITRSKKGQQEMLDEFHSRTMSLNKGGISKEPIATAYRESAINIAALLKVKYPKGTSNKLIRELTGIKNSYRIISANHYNFFEKVSKGIYRFNSNDTIAMENYNKFAELSSFYEEKYLSFK